MSIVGEIWEERYDKLEQECKYYERELKNLLARVHRDGGHHTGAVGLAKSIEDAHIIVAQLVVK